MRLIRNLFGSILFILIAIIIYFNFNKIYAFFCKLIKHENVVVIKETNQYKRKYDYEKFSSYEDFIPENEKDILNIYFNIINNGWDDFTFYCPDDYSNCVEDIRRLSSDKTSMSNINGYVNPFNSFYLINTTVSNNKEVYIKITKKYTETEIKQINNKLDLIFNELNLNTLDNESKIRLFHDYLIKNVVYDEEFAQTKESLDSPNKANGALINGTAVCSGYSDAFAIFLDRLNIPNIMLSSETHTWNLLYLDDYWLHIDATWNDTDNSLYDYNFYMINTNDLLKHDTEQHNFQENFFIEAKQN